MSRCLTKVIIKDFTSSCTMSGLRIYGYMTETNLTGKEYFSTATSESTTDADYTEATLNCTVPLSSNIGLFLNDPENASFNLGAAYADEVITITMNSGHEIDSVVKIDFNITSGTANVEFYDEEDRCIYTQKITAGTNEYDLEEKHLFVYKTYTLKPQFIETKVGSNLKNVDGSITSIKVECSIPKNTDMKFLLSFDNKSTWKTFKSGSWIDCTSNYNATNADKGEVILQKGMSELELESMIQSDYDSLPTPISRYDVDIAIGFITYDDTITPYISRFILNYL